MPKVGDIINELEAIAPPELADDDDRIGLHVGNRESEVHKLCVCVDTSPAVIDLAIQKQADMIVAHHPLIYSPLKYVTDGDPVADRVIKLIKSNTALFVMHTNFDSAAGGINDVLAEKIGITNTIPLTNRKQDNFYKIAVFVPEEAVDDVRNAMANAGAGIIGQYTHCSFRTPGTGSFVPLPTAQPYIGSAGKLEEVNEYRLEMICVGSWLEGVISEMLEKHPYDEVAYDVYQLANDPVIYGYGRVGMLNKDTTLEEFAEHVRSRLEVRNLKISGDPKKTIKRVAICGGGGSSLFREAVKSGADVYVTGDTRHHDLLDADSYGLAMIDAGHFETEKPGMAALAQRLSKSPIGSGLAIEYIE